MNNRFAILNEAKKSVNEKEKSYASPSKNMKRIAKLWSVLLGVKVTPYQVAQCMVAVKLARSMNGYNHDNHVDIIGYSLIMEEVSNVEKSE